MTTAAAPMRWLSIVGIGEDGVEGLSPAARRLIEQAQLVVGGKRHMALAGAFAGEPLAWPSPPEAAFPSILARRGTPVCVLATGDPFFYGIGSLLLKRVPVEETICLASPSAFSLAAARLGWALQDCALVSLHGRAFERIVRFLQPNAKILALSWDGDTPARLASLLVERGFDCARMTVLEAMGGPRERLRTSLAHEFAFDAVDPLNTVAIDIAGGDRARALPIASGLPDDWFEHDGQITKREIRAMTISALAPRRGETLWDIGAGSGSVGIEWMLCDPRNQAIAIEARQDRAARIVRNSAALGTPDLRVVEGSAPDALADLPLPHAIFIGGGVSKAGVVDAAWAALRPGGRLVANAVTLEGQRELLHRYASLGGDLVSVQIARAESVGTMSGWRTAMPVMQWSRAKS